MKIKKLSKEQIIISIDRLSRFKQTEEKYLRVFKDIIISSLIEPKYKKNELDKFDYKELTKLACTIFNNSFENQNSDLTINNILFGYENYLFKNTDETKKLLDNDINYVDALNLVSENTKVPNLRWLKYLAKGLNSKTIREQYLTEHPIEKIVLVEGITEEILLPVFAKFTSYNFQQKGIKIIPAGGKNQVVKWYYELSNIVNIPIFVLLDKDAKDNRESINKKLRKKDSVYVLYCGEFEDLLPKSLILKTINGEFKNFVQLTLDDIKSDVSTVKMLEEIYKDRCLHEFKKADFAHCVAEQISSKDDISDEIGKIISEIKKL